MADDVSPKIVELAALQDEQLAAQDERLLLDPKRPLIAARAFLDAEFPDGTLRHWRGDLYEWTGSHWREADVVELRRRIYEFLEAADQPGNRRKREPFEVNPRRVTDVLDPVKALTNLDKANDAPFWLDGRDSAGQLLAVENGLLDLTTLELQPHSPQYFNLAAVDYPYDPDADDPETWERFLDELWEGDPGCTRTLQEVAGLLLTSDTSFEKLFMISGPRRSGKGTIARTLTAMLGKANVVHPTFASLGQNFGLAPLIGKPLAIIGDARLPRETAVLTERLLSLSGEDGCTVDRKFRDPWSGRLPTRFVIVTNELPAIPDTSGALAGRFIIMPTTVSFYGREDRTLETKLHAERPGILLWAIEGLQRLRQRGQFEPPKSGVEAVNELELLASPVSAFLRDKCNVAPGLTADVDKVWAAWKDWCDEVGRKPSTKQMLGRNLRTALPLLRTTQPRDGDSRRREYEGLELK